MKTLAVPFSRLRAASRRSRRKHIPSSAGNLNVETVASGLDQSVGPRIPARRADARHRTAGTPAHRRRATASFRRAVAGVPPVRASGQGGLHDVVLDRDFATNKTIYFCFAEPASGGGRTAMARASLSDGEAPSSTT